MGSFFLHLLIRAPGSYQSGSLQRGHYLVRDKSPREGVKIIGAIQAISNLGANDLKIETLLITCWFQRLNSCFLSPAMNSQNHMSQLIISHHVSLLIPVDISRRETKETTRRLHGHTFRILSSHRSTGN